MHEDTNPLHFNHEMFISGQYAEWLNWDFIGAQIEACDRIELDFCASIYEDLLWAYKAL